jgi:hypothetical protein
MMPRVVVCLTSFDRLDCTRINEEVFKLNFSHPWIVVHASSGAAATPYLEDTFVACKPRAHVAGAISLMHSAVRAALEFEPDFLIVLDGDTWLLDEQVLLGLISRLHENPALLMAASTWATPPSSFVARLLVQQSSIRHTPGDRLRLFTAAAHRMAYDALDFCTQFCILRNYRPLIDAFLGMHLEDRRPVERQWFDRFSARFSLHRVLRMTEREPTLPKHRFICEKLALYTQHWPASGTSTGPNDETDPFYVKPGTPGKRETLESYPRIRTGDSIQRLLNARSIADLAYYNNGANRY